MADSGASTPSKKRPAGDGDVPGLYPSDNVTIAIPTTGADGRPPTVKHMSAPAYQSPIRHHRREGSKTRKEIPKETLNARSEYSNSEDDGTAQHRINQYNIKQEIGRGSFGAVHLAVDQYGEEYAIKEFSKSRLRKRAQSNLLRRPDRFRRPRGGMAAGLGFNSPLHRQSPIPASEDNALSLIREEIAIMKKLNHPNVVNLIEVLDDPDEDSLYMVLEMCKKGVVMKVGLEDRADPYDEEVCRCYFRDMILGIEYLHGQGIIHRDIKPDNCLVTADDVLKIVDFGVSEMFEKDAEMTTAKSAGSPAFMPPELCVAKHGEVSGRKADIWSMGVTLFCLRFGRIPFEKTAVMDLYESIRSDNFDVGDDLDDNFQDLIFRILEKDPDKRISMDEIREHPWVTKNGTDPLLPKEENTADLIEPPTQEELNAAITGNMGHLLVVMKAVKRFKQVLFKRRPELMDSIFGGASRIVQPPLSMRGSSSVLVRSKSNDRDDRRPIERALTSEGVHRDIEVSDDMDRLPQSVDEVAITVDQAQKAPDGVDPPKPHKDHRLNTPPPPSKPAATYPSPSNMRKGHAHDPLEDHLFLHIGTGIEEHDHHDGDIPVISESPGAVEIDVYEQAYKEEVERILKEKEEKGPTPTLYLTRRVEDIKSLRDNVHTRMGEHLDQVKASGELAKTGFQSLLGKAKENAKDGKEERDGEKMERDHGFKGLIAKAKENARDAVEGHEKRKEEKSKAPESESSGT
ncbi:Pkinase-domain-containing protein [Rhizodiscina lignyota]|uniref:Pkinase-domain-containing protein n=1 Tax=Rhizodiscina lignyota TaxID=1504668 RepID=A0A9P4M232_9PEZI|nr:Pkinase-domain-containing protein [Rhizodiscina lignyota]